MVCPQSQSDTWRGQILTQVSLTTLGTNEEEAAGHRPAGHCRRDAAVDRRVLYSFTQPRTEQKPCASMTPELLSAMKAPVSLGSDNRVLACGPWSLIPDGRRRWSYRGTHLGPRAIRLPIELRIPQDVQGHVAGANGHVLFS